MGTYYLDNDPSAPWCACGTLCDGAADPQGRIGWCAGCDDWASHFGEPVIDHGIGAEVLPLMRYDPERCDFFEWCPVTERWEVDPVVAD